MPLPPRVSTAGELEALLRNETASEAVPLDCGVNTTWNAALCPGESVSGKEIPLSVNSDVPKEAEETVTLDPLALIEAGMLALCPTTTLPKLKLAGEAINCPTAAPVPVIEMMSDGLEAFDVIEMLPVALPAEVGLKPAPKVKLCPGASVKGKLSPVTLKPDPEALAWLTMTVDPPELVRVSGRL